MLDGAGKGDKKSGKTRVQVLPHKQRLYVLFYFLEVYVGYFAVL